MTDKYPMCEKFDLSRQRRQLVEPDKNGDYTDIMLTKDVEAKLQSLHDSAPVVYGYKVNGIMRADENVHPEFDTFTAKLMFIEEIKKPECVHEPLIGFSGVIKYLKFNECKHCGIKLKATWESAE